MDNRSEPLRIFLVEDSAALRQRLVVLLESCEGVRVIGTAGSVVESIEAVLAAAPDVLVLDLRIIGGSGLEVLKAVRPAFPSMRIAVLTNYATEQHRTACLAAGADAFLDKSMEFALIPGIVSEWRAERHPVGC